MRWFLGAVLSFVGFVSPAVAQTNGAVNVTLAWDQSVSPNIASYRLYYGTSSGNYTNISETGDATTTTVTNLMVGSTYYFAVSAVDLIGLESVLSSEVSYTVGTPLVATLALRADPGQGTVLSALGPANYVYDLLVSPDLQTWATIASVTNGANGAVQFVDSEAPTNSARFYRLRQTSP